ncbi:unnamed protein product, partial [Mesorhabditis spiculigera]
MIKPRRESYNQANKPLEEPAEAVEFPILSQAKPSGPKKCLLALKAAPSHYAEDGCYFLEFDESDASEKQFLFFAKVLHWIGLRFDPRFSCGVTSLRFLWLSVIICVGIYSAVFDTLQMITNFEQKAAPSTLTFLVMAVQLVTVMLLMTFWQRHLSFEKFFHYYRHARDAEESYLELEKNASIVRNLRRFWTTQAYVLLTVASFSYVLTSSHRYDIIHSQHAKVFYFEKLVYIRPVACFIYCTVLNVALHTYICLSNAIYWEAKKFNVKLYSLKADSSAEMKFKLEHLIRLSARIHRTVRELDSIYKIYAFFTITLIIPSSLFVMLMVFSRKTAVEMAISMPAVLFCVYQYYGIMYPARLHDELNRSKAALCMNHHVWVPYEKSVNKLAQTLVMHVEQADLGISLWGFAIVTKPLILTTVSVLMTCLAFLLELRPRPGQAITASENQTISG